MIVRCAPKASPRRAGFGDILFRTKGPDIGSWKKTTGLLQYLQSLELLQARSGERQSAARASNDMDSRVGLRFQGNAPWRSPSVGVFAWMPDLDDKWPEGGSMPEEKCGNRLHVRSVMIHR